MVWVDLHCYYVVSPAGTGGEELARALGWAGAGAGASPGCGSAACPTLPLQWFVSAEDGMSQRLDAANRTKDEVRKEPHSNLVSLLQALPSLPRFQVGRALTHVTHA